MIAVTFTMYVALETGAYNKHVSQVNTKHLPYVADCVKIAQHALRTARETAKTSQDYPPSAPVNLVASNNCKILREIL